MIIDDHPLVIDGIRTMLDQVEYLSVEGSARTAEEALFFLSQSKTVELILLDINLADIDGLELCKIIRQQNKSVKIIGLSYIYEGNNYPISKSRS